MKLFKVLGVYPKSILQTKLNKRNAQLEKKIKLSQDFSQTCRKVLEEQRLPLAKYIQRHLQNPKNATVFITPESFKNSEKLSICLFKDVRHVLSYMPEYGKTYQHFVDGNIISLDAEQKTLQEKLRNFISGAVKKYNEINPKEVQR